MKTNIAHFLLLFGLGSTIAMGSDPTRPITTDELKTLALMKDVDAERAREAATSQRRMIVGEPTSSLTYEQAVDLAQHVAALIPKGFVAKLPPDYTGDYAPVLPVNAVYVVESVEAPELRPFDLVVFSGPLRGICVRRLLSISEGKGTVGFEFMAKETHTEIGLDECIGRVVATILCKPQKTPEPSEPPPAEPGALPAAADGATAPTAVASVGA